MTHSRVPREERWNVPSLPAPCWIVPSTSGTWVLGSAAPPAGTLRPLPVSQGEGHSWEWAERGMRGESWGKEEWHGMGRRVGIENVGWGTRGNRESGMWGYLIMGRVECREPLGTGRVGFTGQLGTGILPRLLPG